MAPKKRAAPKAAPAIAAMPVEAEYVDKRVLCGIPVVPHLAFNAEESNVVIDLKGLHEIPFDTESNGTKSFRALIFPKDRVSHIDERVGNYVVHGDYEVVTGLSIVYFRDGTLLLPNLLLSFIDHGWADADQSGISVESLPLPLMKGSKRYEKYSVIRPIEDIAGFSSLPKGMPWCVHLAPTLKGLTVQMGYSIAGVGVTDLSSLQIFIDGPLEDRIDQLFELAADAVEVEVAAQATQDQRAAQTVRVRFMAKLKSMREKYDGMKLSNYDEPLESRILTLADDAQHMVLSPLRKSLEDGSAVLIRTTLHQRTADAVVEAQMVEPVALSEHVEPMAEEEDDAHIVSEREEEEEVVPPQDVVVQLPPVRVRTQTVRSPPVKASPIKKKKPMLAMKAAKKVPFTANMKQPPAQSASSSGSRIGQFNPRSGVIYTREPYATKYTAPASALKVAASGMSDEAALAMAEKYSVLKVENATLKERVTSLEGQLIAKDILMVKSVQSAKLRERQAVSHELRASYQEGLNDAVRLMSKKEIKKTRKFNGKEAMPQSHATDPESDHSSDYSDD